MECFKDGSTPSDLTDAQWDAIKDSIPPAREGGRRRTTDTRAVMNACFYLVRSGCAWRYLPRDFPPWQTVYGYFSRWLASGLWKNLNGLLSQRARIAAGREPFPSVLIIDSQSVRRPFGEERGYDGFKKLRGRKRHIIVDTMGLVYEVKAQRANGNDGRLGIELLQNLQPKREIEVFYADAGYTGNFQCRIYGKFRIWPTIPKPMEKNKDRSMSNLKPTRWVVERTFAWLNHYRRLSQDYERAAKTSEGMVYAAMTQLLLRRLSRLWHRLLKHPPDQGTLHHGPPQSQEPAPTSPRGPLPLT